MDDRTSLLGRLDLETKVGLLTGADFWTTRPIPAIGLGRIVLSDGPSGVRGEVCDERLPSLNLPSATALGATWDPTIAYRYGAVLAAEARRKGVHVVLGPTVNLHRSPLGGRHFEALSEDPLLTGRIAAAYVRGLQDHGVAAAPKHYVANDFETERFTADVDVDDRTLRELYLAPFEAAVTAGAWLVMSAYNAVRGTTMTENDLLRSPLCEEWGFDGVVVSDWAAVRSTEASATARQDLAMPGPESPWGSALVDAVRAGRVPEAAVDEKVSRLLRLAERVGVLDGHEATAAEPPTAQECLAFTREMCAAGTVLLRNDGELPWQPTVPRSIAVVGEHAATPRTQGGGSATVLPDHVVSPLDGLRAALPDTEITDVPGVPVHQGIEPLPVTAMTDPVTGDPGMRATFRSVDGTELRDERRLASNLVWLGNAPEGAAVLELRTRYRPPGSGTVQLGIGCVGRVELSLDGRAVLDARLIPEGTGLGAALLDPPVASVTVETGVEMDLAVRYELPATADALHVAAITVGTCPADRSVDAALADAAAAARGAEVAVVVVGTSAHIESEGFDRTGLGLPGAQDELVRVVAAANPRTVVVVNAGGPVLMPWRDEVAAVLLTWFGGQELGNALADMLLGTTEPGGRLPTTWPATEADVPVLDTAPKDGVVRYDEGIHVGYRAWLRDAREPAYPFGHGLGYTTWALAHLDVPPPTGDAVEVTVQVRNTGTRYGRQVVQAYLSRADSAVDRPTRWLAGFTVVDAEPGDVRTARVTLAPRAFTHWDDGWRTEPGVYTVHVGTDAENLPLSATLTR